MNPITVLLIVLLPMVAGFAGATSDRKGFGSVAVGFGVGVIFGLLYAFIGLTQLAPTALVLATVGGVVSDWCPNGYWAKKYLNLNRYFR